MSRHGYTEGGDDEWAMIRWRGAVSSALRGSRGQKLLKELAAAMDAMPEKRLIEGELVNEDGEHCALGVVGAARQLDLKTIDPENYDQVASNFDIAAALAREIEWVNDDYGHNAWMRMDETTPEARWKRVREWVDEKITKEQT